MCLQALRDSPWAPGLLWEPPGEAAVPVGGVPGLRCRVCLQDLDEDDFDEGKPKKQRRSIVRTTSMTRVGGNWCY